MRNALPENRINRVLLSRAFLLRGAWNPRTRVRRIRVSSIYFFIFWTLSAVWVATILYSIRDLICVSRAPRIRLYIISAIWAIYFFILYPVILLARRYLFTFIYRSTNSISVSRFKTTLNIRLYTPVTLRRYSF